MRKEKWCGTRPSPNGYRTCVVKTLCKVNGTSGKFLGLDIREAFGYLSDSATSLAKPLRRATPSGVRGRSSSSPGA